MALNNYFSRTKNSGDQSGRYLITYVDLITLLLGLFVILYASAQIDESKYKEMSAAFSAIFNPADSVKTGGKGILAGGKQLTGRNSAKLRTVASLEEKAQNVLGTFVRNSGVEITISGSSLILTLPELVLFTSGSAELQSESGELLDSLASLLSSADMLINVDGHTDSSPIRTFRYESNWHLSTSRAINTAYSMIARGVKESNIVVRGFGSQRPIADNSTEDGKRRNRRVEIAISELPDDVPTTQGYGEKIPQ